MQNMHQHPLAPHFVIGDEGFHSARGQRLQQFVFFSEFHAWFAIPLKEGSLLTQDYTSRLQAIRKQCRALNSRRTQPIKTVLSLAPEPCS
jgi:hypothetical protein